MKDEHWLKELAQVNREKEAEERDQLDERWDRLSAGELSPEEEAELRALAETSEEAREAYEAFRPLGAEFQARMVSTLLAELKGRAPAEPEEQRSWILRFRPTITRFGGWVTATAAALYLLVRIIAPQPPLPAYASNLTGGVQAYRGESDPAKGLPVFVPGSLLTLDVRPQQSVTGRVEAHGFLARGAEIVAWEPPPPFDISDKGAVRLRGTLGQDIQLPPGNWRIWVVVGRPRKIPSIDELQAELRAGSTRHEDWQAVSADLRVEDRASP